MTTPKRFLSHQLCIKDQLLSGKIIEFFPDGTYVLNDFRDEVAFTTFCDGLLFVASVDLEPELNELFSVLSGVEFCDLPFQLMASEVYKKNQYKQPPYALFHCLPFEIKRLQ